MKKLNIIYTSSTPMSPAYTYIQYFISNISQARSLIFYIIFLYGAFFGSRGRMRTLSPLFLTRRQVDCSLTGIIRSTVFHNEYCSVRNTVIQAWRYCICINGERQLTVHNLYRTYIYIYFLNILDTFLINLFLINNKNSKNRYNENKWILLKYTI